MAKTNFTKVEEALVEGLRKLTISQLIEMADAASKEGKVILATKTLEAIQKASLNAIKRDLQKLHKQDPQIYTTIGIKKADIKNFIEKSLTDEEWESIKQIKNKLDAYKKEISSKGPQGSDDQIIESERLKHINKRFNVNEKWLPLK